MAESASGSRPAGRPPGQSHKATGTPLAGRVVLLPRLRERDRIASALERAGSQVLRAAVTRTVPGDTAVLEVTARRIVAGEAAWLVLTSARTVEVLAPYLLAEVGIGPTAGAPGHRDAPDASNADPDAAASPARAASSEQRQLATATSSMRVAVVGPATGRAWTGLTGASPDLVARGSATALLEEPELACSPPVPSAAKRVLLPASSLADPALVDGLRRAGWEVEQVAAYTTTTTDASDLPPGLARTWATGGVDAVVLTAPSTTRAVLKLLGSPPPGTRLVAIGATTAAAARELGLPVAAIASSPTPEGLLQAVISAIQTSTSPATLTHSPSFQRFSGNSAERPPTTRSTS